MTAHSVSQEGRWRGPGARSEVARRGADAGTPPEPSPAGADPEKRAADPRRRRPDLRPARVPRREDRRDRRRARARGRGNRLPLLPEQGSTSSDVVFDEKMDELLARGRTIVASEASAAERLTRLVDLHLTFFAADRDLASLFQIELRRSARIAPARHPVEARRLLPAPRRRPERRHRVAASSGRSSRPGWPCGSSSAPPTRSCPNGSSRGRPGPPRRRPQRGRDAPRGLCPAGWTPLLRASAETREEARTCRAGPAPGERRR